MTSFSSIVTAAVSPLVTRLYYLAVALSPSEVPTFVVLSPSVSGVGALISPTTVCSNDKGCSSVFSVTIVNVPTIAFPVVKVFAALKISTSSSGSGVSVTQNFMKSHLVDPLPSEQTEYP